MCATQQTKQKKSSPVIQVSSINQVYFTESQKKKIPRKQVSSMNKEKKTLRSTILPNLMLVCARSSSTPMARRTYEGSKEADVHALPLETAMFLSAINNDSP